MLKSLAEQSRLPDQVIIIDEGQPIGDLAREFPQLDLQVLSLSGGSTSAKRNAGVRAARPDMTLIGFLDDDIVLEPGTLEVMLAFWETAPPDLGGASCNLVNPPPIFASRFKSLRITSWLGLYGRKNGAVLRSGICIYTGPPHETIYTSWLCTAAVIYSRRVVEEFPFDEWFERYGFLEDLDMSYRAGKKYKLAVVAGARFYHYPSQLGRPDPYLFGKKEVLNRLYFVSKHAELSLGLCVIGLLTRTAANLFLGISTREVAYLKRAWGNCAGLLLALTTGMKPVTR
jgi:GT2 family glycosyltransferase